MGHYIAAMPGKIIDDVKQTSQLGYMGAVVMTSSQTTLLQKAEGAAVMVAAVVDVASNFTGVEGAGKAVLKDVAKDAVKDAAKDLTEEAVDTGVKTTVKEGASSGEAKIEEAAETNASKPDATPEESSAETGAKSDATCTEENTTQTKGFDRDAATAGYQDHHIISDKNALTKDHELIGLSGFDLQSRANKIFLPTDAALDSSRSLHLGRHWNSVSANLSDQMTQVANFGKENGWTQAQFSQGLKGIIGQERGMLRSGQRALNKIARPGAQ